MKFLFNAVLFGLIFLSSLNISAQSYSGCVVGNTVYTDYYGTSGSTRYYDDDITQYSACGWSRSSTGQFTCRVYDGSGSKNNTSNYTGPYQGGIFTLIVCPLDKHACYLVFALGLIGGRRLLRFNQEAIRLKV